MTKPLRLSILLVASVSMLACSTPRSSVISLVKDGVQVSAKLGRVSVNGATEASFVHARLTLHNKGRRLKSVNLNCLVLTIGNVVSDEINVDSVASVLNDPYPANTDGQIKVSVYWVFSSGKIVDIRELPVSKLSVRSDLKSPCFRY